MAVLKTVSIEHAPALLRVLRTISSLMFMMPVVVIFYQYKGLTVGDFFLLQGLFAFSGFVLEIPTGYIGDLFSRKKVIVASLLVWFLGDLIRYFCSGFSLIFLAEMCFALAAALYSGTAEAYIFDILKKQGKDQDYLREWGRINTWTSVAIASATFLGGVLYYKLGPDAVALVQASVNGIGFCLALFLPEIPEVRRVVAKGKSKWQDILDISKYAATHHEIKWLMFLPATFGAGALLLMWGLQPLMEYVGIPVFLFGVFAGLGQAARATFAHFSHRLFNRLRTNRFSLMLFGGLVSGFLAAMFLPMMQNMVLVYVLLLIVCIVPGSQIALRIVTSSMINHRIKSDERATVLSVSAMSTSLCKGMTMIALKFLLDGWNLSGTFAVLGIVILALTGYSLVKLLRLRIV